jgi:hypothetical protein
MEKSEGMSVSIVCAKLHKMPIVDCSTDESSQKIIVLIVGLSQRGIGMSLGDDPPAIYHLKSGGSLTSRSNHRNSHRKVHQN